MDTPIIAKFYREEDAMKRLALLEKSIAEGEEPEKNAIRKELWNLRYQDKGERNGLDRADGYLGLWMAMEFNKNADKRLFGKKHAQKEIQKILDKLKFREYQEKSPLHEELLYRECCHMVDLYVRLCGRDKSYNSAFCGIVRISEEKSKNKVQRDIFEMGEKLPKILEMEKELEIVSRAAKEVYDLHFSQEDLLTE